MATIPRIVLGKDCFPCDIRPVIKGEQQIAMTSCVVRPHHQRLAITCLSLGVAALGEQCHSEIGQPTMLVRCQADRRAACRLSRDGPTRAREQGADIAMCQCVSRIQGQRPTECHKCFSIVIQCEKYGSDIAMGDGACWVVLHGLAEG